jgi:hypothetical protein
MDEQQLHTISEQIATILRAAVSDKAGYVLITASSEGNGNDIHLYSNLDPLVIISMFSALAQDIVGKDEHVTIN